MKSLTTARKYGHAAIQWVSKAARANLASKEDDSHSSLYWDAANGVLAGLSLDRGNRHRFAFCFRDASMLWMKEDEILNSFSIQDASDADIGLWVDSQLELAGLHGTAKADMPYELETIDCFEFDDDVSPNIRILGTHFAQAQDALTDLIASVGEELSLAETPVVRCWPHHFDIATLFAFANGTSIGVGFSPGDQTYNEPYYYCSPWPYPDAGTLPDAPGPFHWHTDGFTSLVATSGTLPEKEQLSRLLIVAVGCAHSTMQDEQRQ